MIWISSVCEKCYSVCTGMEYTLGSIETLKARTIKRDWKILDGKLYCPKCQERLKKGVVNNG